MADDWMPTDVGGVPINVILLLVGFLFAFFGRTFFKAVWFLIGGLIGMAAGLVIGGLVGMLIGQPVMCALIAVIIGFIVGGYMGISWARWLMCLAAAGAGYFIGAMVSGSWLVGVIVAIVFFIIIYVKFDDILSVMTAIIGGAMVGGVASQFVGPDLSLIVFFVVAIPVAIAGMYVQLQIDKRWPEKSYRGEQES